MQGVARSRFVFVLGVAVVISCARGEQAGCARTPAGGACNPMASNPNAQCQVGYYCANSETCTRKCTADSDCRVDCSADAGVCATVAECNTNMGSVCEGSRLVSCVSGFCQGNCDITLDGGGCDYDFYGPSQYQHQDGG